MPVGIATAAYLTSEALFVSAPNLSGVAWADRGIETELISPFVEEADAQTEAVRQAAFMAGPLVEDVVTVSGARRDLLGKSITVKSNRLGYDAGVPAFVIGYRELAGVTELNVVRSL